MGVFVLIFLALVVIVGFGIVGVSNRIVPNEKYTQFDDDEDDEDLW